jgi:tRNA-dihydrouridine synthase B
MDRIYPENSIILAPLSGFTDLPYRNSARRHGCIYAFTEMIDAGSLAYGSDKTDIMLKRGEADKWLGVQLVGSDHDRIEKAAKILNECDFDLLDFNLGCPAPKVSRKGAGAALGMKPDEAVSAFEIIIRSSRFPVTAKIRILDEEDPAPTVRLVKMLENAGARAVTIHGRIKKAYYSGPVFFDIIAAAKEAAGIQVIGNGGIMDIRSCREMQAKTGCDSVMVARGAMGNPWLFSELADYESYIPPSPSELADEMEKHVLEMIDFYGEELAMKISRKVILDYMRGRGFTGTFKSEVSFLNTRADLDKFMFEVRKGPSERYWRWLVSFPESERRLRQEENTVTEE